MECLDHLIDNAINVGAWKPVRASRNGPPISNLVFDDDLILFSKAKEDQAKIIVASLNQFCDMSGSKVSRNKSKVFCSNNTQHETRSSICAALDIEETNDLGAYLGVPTINGRTSTNEYQFLVDKINGKLSGWKAKIISIEGRATLAQSRISSMPYYSMQTTKLPRSTCDEIDRISWHFLWGGA